MGEQEDHYTDAFTAVLEILWGAGFLSPGGAREISRIVEGVEVAGKTVLDIGCGIGGPAVALVETHRAARVVGIDIEAPPLARARALVQARGLSDRIELLQVEPGPLPFPDQSFDLVFSKDSIIHVPDKAALFAECLRVLRPGGWIALSDWCRGEAAFTPEMERWLEMTALGFEMAPIGETGRSLEAAGFEDVETRDRNAWFAALARADSERMAGPDRARLVEVLGEEGIEAWLERCRLRALVAEQGQLRPAHLRGRKPA